MSVDREAQEDELLALASIYDEEEFHRAESAQGGEIRLCLELPSDFKVVTKGGPVTKLSQDVKPVKARVCPCYSPKVHIFWKIPFTCFFYQ